MNCRLIKLLLKANPRCLLLVGDNGWAWAGNEVPPVRGGFSAATTAEPFGGFILHLFQVEKPAEELYIPFSLVENENKGNTEIYEIVSLNNIANRIQSF